MTETTQRTGGQVAGSRIIGTVAATTLEARTVRLPDGRTKTVAVVHRPPAVGVVVLRIGAGGVVETLLIRQPRPAAGDPALVEIVAGKVDPGEVDPVAVGKRELAEEVGLHAEQWRVIATDLLPSPGWAAERLHLVAAWDLSTVPSRPEDAHITSEWVPLADAAAMVGGPIQDAKTAVGVLLAERRHQAWLEDLLQGQEPDTSATTERAAS